MKTTLATPKTAARVWLADIEPRLDSYPPAQALRLAQKYDHLHRLAYGQAPLPLSIVDRQVFRALQSLIKGDKEIDQYLLYRMITIGLNRGIKEYRLLPLRWQSQRLASWYKKYQQILSSSPVLLSENPVQSSSCPPALLSENPSAPSAPLREIIPAELSLLLASDLTPFTGRDQAPFKARLRALLRLGKTGEQ